MSQPTIKFRGSDGEYEVICNGRVMGTVCRTFKCWYDQPAEHWYIAKVRDKWGRLQSQPGNRFKTRRQAAEQLIVRVLCGGDQ